MALSRRYPGTCSAVRVWPSASLPCLAMKDEQYRFLTILGQPPARLTADQAAWVLNFQAHDVPVLVASRLLKPLGNPQPNSVKYFATVELLELARDRAWLAKATNAVSNHWRVKNAHKKERFIPELCPPPHAGLS